MSNKNILWIALAVFVLGFVAGNLNHHYICHPPCAVLKESDTVVIVKKSTDTLHTVWRGTPLVETVIRNKTTHDTVAMIEYRNINTPISVHDTLVYNDTFTRPDTFQLVIRERVASNQIVERELKYRNLVPEKWKVITNTVVKPSPLLRVYAYARVQVPVTGFEWSKCDAAPGLQLSIKDKGFIGADFGVVNRQLGISGGVRLFGK